MTTSESRSIRIMIIGWILRISILFTYMSLIVWENKTTCRLFIIIRITNPAYWIITSNDLIFGSFNDCYWCTFTITFLMEFWCTTWVFWSSVAQCCFSISYVFFNLFIYPCSCISIDHFAFKAIIPIFVYYSQKCFGIF